MPELRLTVLIGTYAQKHYLGAAAKKNLTETVRAYRDYGPGRIPLVHPSPLNFRWQATPGYCSAGSTPAACSSAYRCRTRPSPRHSRHPAGQRPGIDQVSPSTRP